MGIPSHSTINCARRSRKPTRPIDPPSAREPRGSGRSRHETKKPINTMDDNQDRICLPTSLMSSVFLGVVEIVRLLTDPSMGTTEAKDMVATSLLSIHPIECTNNMIKAGESANNFPEIKSMRAKKMKTNNLRRGSKGYRKTPSNGLILHQKDSGKMWNGSETEQSSGSNNRHGVRRLLCLLTILLAIAPVALERTSGSDEINLILRIPWLAFLAATFWAYRGDMRRVTLLPLTVFITFPSTLFYVLAFASWSVSGFAP